MIFFIKIIKLIINIIMMSHNSHIKIYNFFNNENFILGIGGITNVGIQIQYLQDAIF